MATVNKNFRIKHGLIVEGTSGTIGGQNILTETGGDSYILNLVGGATLVKSVGSNLSVDGAGELSLDLVGIVEDIAGTRLTTDGSTLNVDVDGIADDLTGSYDFATNSDVTFAVGAEATNRDAAISAAVTNLEAYADQAEADAITSANSYTDGRETAITTAYQSYADTAEADAKTYADGLAVNYDAAGSAATAEQNAKDYADNKINDASNLSTEVWSAYKTGTEISVAQTAAQDYADTAISALVDSAPATLDTLNELAAALQDNPDIISDLQTIAAGKQDTLTAGSNIDITGSTISVTGLDSEDISDFNTAALSATSAAYDAAGAAAAAQTAAEATAQAALNNVLDATTAFTEINVNDQAKQIAATSTITTGSASTVYQWAKADYRSAKLLVKIDNGTHNEISEILLTLDSSDNVAITEYAIVGTNGSRGTIAATISGLNVIVTVNPTDSSTVKVTGTLLK
jgi:hypothetical protein